MPRVICTLPNASDNINGFKFESCDAGVLSEDLPDEAAELFLSIPGYEPYVDESAAKADLLARAQAVGLKVVPQWGLTRLRKEVEDAETAKKK